MRRWCWGAESASVSVGWRSESVLLQRSLAKKQKRKREKDEPQIQGGKGGVVWWLR